MYECLNMIRTLVERGFIVAAGDGDQATETAGPTAMHEVNWPHVSWAAHLLVDATWNGRHVMTMAWMWQT